MKTAKAILFLLLSINWVYGQSVSDKQLIHNIDFGYTTRYDIEKILGKGEYITDKISYPDYEQTSGNQGYTKYNGLYYKELGITFVCAQDGEKISSIQFRKPFASNFGFDKNLQVGITKIKDIFPRIDTLKLTTSGASFYWSFQLNGYTFFIEKPTKDKNKIIYSDVPDFKDNLNYYTNQPIKIVTLEKWNPENSNYEPTENGIGFYTVRPTYAPKSEKYLNTYEMGWPKNLPLIFLPLYAKLGGGKSERIKQGYWKEYAPNHKISFEGEYRNDKKTGLFKYYDKTGKLERTVNYIYFPSIPIDIYLLFGLIVIWLTLTIIKRKKTTP
jgi:hypothetical protein